MGNRGNPITFLFSAFFFKFSVGLAFPPWCLVLCLNDHVVTIHLYLVKEKAVSAFNNRDNSIGFVS